MNKRLPSLLIGLFASLMGIAQGTIALGPVESIQYRDTVNNVATDSFIHNFGKIPILPNRLEKPFQYLGEEKVQITKAWTGDPHYICRYPKDSLVPGQHYKFTICFYTKRHGKMYKSMGLRFSNGEVVVFRFLADVEEPVIINDSSPIPNAKPEEEEQ